MCVYVWVIQTLGYTQTSNVRSELDNTGTLLLERVVLPVCSRAAAELFPAWFC